LFYQGFARFSNVIVRFNLKVVSVVVGAYAEVSIYIENVVQI
jgi:hypothetical protein